MLRPASALCPRSYRRDVRRTMGRSVHRYVVERRVQRARSLLLAGERSIAQVALATGFAHQSHLARWMKRLLGVTPAALLRET